MSATRLDIGAFPGVFTAPIQHKGHYRTLRKSPDSARFGFSTCSRSVRYRAAQQRRLRPADAVVGSPVMDAPAVGGHAADAHAVDSACCSMNSPMRRNFS